MRLALPATRYPIEFALLALLCAFLPLLEAPKNLAWLAYAAAWLANRIRDRDFGGPWDGWDTLFATWIASGFVVAAFAGLDQSQWKGAGDLLRYGSLAWLVKRSGYGVSAMRALVGVLVASTVAGLAFGYWQLLVTGKRKFLELHSVGHVNHTAIYLAIVLGACTAWFFARWKAWTAPRRAVAGVVAALVLGSLVVTQSRGAAGIGLVAIPILAAAWWPRWRAPLVASAVVVTVTIALAVGLGAEVVKKQQARVQQQNVLALRDGVWRVAMVAWEKFPLFGVGMDNYSGITPERVEQWRRESGKPYDANDYARFPHGHSLLFNTLAERGAFGTAVLAIVLAAWLAALWRRRPRPGDRDHDWLLWGASFAAWFVTVGAGTVNTTLHHEHAILATLLLSFWLGSRPRAARV